MQAHMSAADDLAVAAVFVLFDDFDVELHVFLEAAIRAHVEGAGIQRQADVDELSGWQVQVHEILALLSATNRNGPRWLSGREICRLDGRPADATISSREGARGLALSAPDVRLGSKTASLEVSK
jgi:hypothetical protein